MKMILNPFRFSRGIFSLMPLLFCFFISIQTSMAQPRMEVKEAKKNFGYVKRGEIVQNVYEVKNTGLAPLILLEAEVACSCTTVEFSKQPIMPGQTSTITVSFNTTTVYGRQDRIVFMHCNTPDTPIKLRFKGIVSSK